MQIRAGFSENYDIVGKHLAQDESFVKQFFRHESACEQLFPQNSVIRFNSDYMDVLGNWYFLKPGAVPTSIIIIAGLLFIIPLMVLITLKLDLAEISTFIFVLGQITLLLGIGMVAFLFFKIRRDFFHYTYYPMRFHRAERKVYVTQPNKKVMVYNWDDLKITLHSSARNHFFIHLSVTDPYQKVLNTFALPYVSAYGCKDGLLGHWEFFRRYMQDELPQDSFDSIKEYYNIHGRKEKLSEIFYATIMVDRDSGDDMENADGDEYQLKLQLIAFPILFWAFFSRYLHEIFNRVPPNTGHFYVDEEKYKTDPYNIENKLKDFKRHIPLTAKQKLILSTWGPCSLLLFYLLLEAMTYSAKGETLLLGYLF